MFLLPLTFIVKRINPWPGPSSLRARTNTRAACSSAGLEASRLPITNSSIDFSILAENASSLRPPEMDPALRQVDLLSGHPLYCNNVRRGLHRACAIRVHVARTRIQALLLIRRSSLISTYSLPVEI